MNQELLKEISDSIEEMNTLFERCIGVTNRLFYLDVESTVEELNSTVEERGEIISALTKQKQALNESIEKLPENEQETLRSIISGGFNANHIPEELKEIRSAAINMQSLYSQVVEGDKRANERVRAVRSELKDKLESLNQDKKRLDYYSNMNYGGKQKTGGSFDSQT